MKSETINFLKCVSLLSYGQTFGVGELSQILGNGSNAYVRLCRHGGRKYAVKIYDKNKINEPKKRKRVLLEIHLLGKVAPHSNIIQLYQAYEDKKNIYLIFDYIEGAVTLNQYFQ